MERKNHEIKITLNHYESSDWKCKYSNAVISIDDKSYDLSGMTAESTFRLMKDIAEISIKEEGEKNDNKDNIQ